MESHNLLDTDGKKDTKESGNFLFLRNDHTWRTRRSGQTFKLITLPA